MVASANPSGVNRNGKNNNNNANSNGAGPENIGGASSSAPAQTALRHNPGLSLEWTPEEQTILEDMLSKYASEAAVVRYAMISQALKDKTVRDIALRCRWMNKKENGKRRKDDHNSRKSKDKKPMMMESDDGISYKAIGGAAGQLLEQSAQALDQISTNFSAFKIHENIELFCQARTNILSILNNSHELPELMKQMPPLPVKLNEELANSILPPSPMANIS